MLFNLDNCLPRNVPIMTLNINYFKDTNCKLLTVTDSCYLHSITFFFFEKSLGLQATFFSFCWLVKLVVSRERFVLPLAEGLHFFADLALVQQD